jgi:hypothetical protein
MHENLLVTHGIYILAVLQVKAQTNDGCFVSLTNVPKLNT